MIQQIKDRYKQLDSKVGFIEEAAEIFERSPLTLRVHWFGNFWRVPQGFQLRVLALLEQKIKEQNEVRELKVTDPVEL